MKSQRIIRTLAATGLVASFAVLTTGTLAGASTSNPNADPHAAAHALFVESDQATNTVLSYVRNADGTLAYVATYPTGGNGATASGAQTDPLASQGGLALIDNGAELIATNPGSDTVSLFKVHGAVLDLVQQISTRGDFPVSVSSHGDLVSVLNAGGAGSVSEYQLRGPKLVPLAGQVRSLGLANTTPPFFVAGPGQVGYSPDGRFLVVTTKASTNSFEVFTVAGDGTLAASATVTPAAHAVPFAFNFDSAGRLVAVEVAGTWTSTYTVNSDGSLTLIGSVQEGGAALCWIASAQGYFYGSNAGSGTLSSFSETPSGAPTLLSAVAAVAHPGTTDATASPDGQFLYVESGASGTIDVYAVASNGSLSPVETLSNLPIPFEGIAAS
jgi:6-phosphogluconolactonase (cycloisomerase 2 family)